MPSLIEHDLKSVPVAGENSPRNLSNANAACFALSEFTLMISAVYEATVRHRRTCLLRQAHILKLQLNCNSTQLNSNTRLPLVWEPPSPLLSLLLFTVA